jgi:hypothetical protein
VESDSSPEADAESPLTTREPVKPNLKVPMVILKDKRFGSHERVTSKLPKLDIKKSKVKRGNSRMSRDSNEE